MGLDATVYCNCYEMGWVTQFPQPDSIYIDESGEVFMKWNLPGADFHAFDQWREHACEHERGQLVSRRIGNIARVGVCAVF